MKNALVALLILPVLAWSQQSIDDPNAEKRQLKGSFHAVHISNAFDCFFSRGSEEALAVSAATEEIRENIRTSVENGVLTIKFLEPEKFWKYTGPKKLKVYISYKQLDELVVSGACDIFFREPLRTKELLVKLSGSSDLRTAIEAEKLNFHLSGASDVAISGGSADELIIDAKGASEFNAFDLKVNTCNADVSGASTVHMTVNKELNVKASGASSVQFKGEGRINQVTTTGASKVNRKG